MNTTEEGDVVESVFSKKQVQEFKDAKLFFEYRHIVEQNSKGYGDPKTDVQWTNIYLNNKS